MALIAVNRPAVPDFGVALRHPLRALKVAVRRYLVYRRTFVELNALGDRDLADLGIARAQLREIARQTAAAV